MRFAPESRSASDHEQVLAGFYLYVSQAGVALQQFRQTLTSLHAQTLRNLPLRVEVDEEGPVAFQGESSANVHAARGLRDPALRVDKCYLPQPLPTGTPIPDS